MKQGTGKGDVLPGLVITLAAAAGGLAGCWHVLDETLSSWGKQLAPERDPGEAVVLIEIDGRSLGAYADRHELAAELAAGLARVAAAGPAVTGLLLPREWRDLPLDTAAPAGGVILGVGLDRGSRPPAGAAEAEWLGPAVLASRLEAPPASDARGAVWQQRLGLSRTLPRGRAALPAGIPDPAVTGIGLVPGAGDPRMARSPAAVARVGDHYLPALSVQLAAAALGGDPADIRLEAESGLLLGGEFRGTDSGYHFRPHPFGQGSGPAIPRYGLHELLGGEVPEQRLSDAAVLVAVTAEDWAEPMPRLGGAAQIRAERVAGQAAALVEDHLYQRPEAAALAAWSALALVGLYLMIILPRLGPTVGGLLTLLGAVVLFNLQVGMPVVRMTELALGMPLVALIGGHLAVAGKQLIDRRRSRMRAALSEANLELAATLQKQGQLEAAVERCLRCPPTREMLDRLYDLAMDLERRRRFAKARHVLQQLEQRQPGYRDVAERIRHVQDLEQRSALGSNRADTPTLILDQEGMQKPVLGHYEITEEIGRGAMGVVYRGHDPRIGRTVAIKTLALSQEFEGDDLQEMTQRFFREAETAGRLNHPSIVTIYDVGEEGDLAYIAMDYLEGEGLEAYTQPDRLLPTVTVFDIIAQVAEALEYAHERNVVHRDVKPANMIYDPETRRVIVTDFGVAGLTDARKTKTGTILGTPSYMSPEQVLGKPVAGPSDLFSLGVTFYEMIRGEMPFEGEPMATLMYKIANERHPNIRKNRPDLPPCTARLVNRVLAKDPQERFASGSEFAAALRRCRREVVARQKKHSDDSGD